MTDTTFFDGFTMTWSQDGTQSPISQDAYKAGWAFIGDTPPAREQFNTVHWLDGKRQQWLFGQIKAVTDYAGLTLSAGDSDTLQEAIADQIGEAVANAQPATISSTTTNQAADGSHTHELAATGVNAGSYGTKSQIPVCTFDAKGRVTSASTSKVSVGDVQDVLALANGGTGASDAGGARTELGLASFLRIAAATLAAEGYMRLQTNDDSQAILLQWGSGTLPSGSKTPSTNITFPTPFAAVWHVNPMPELAQVTAGGFNAVVCVAAKSLTGATVQADVNEESGSYTFNKNVPFTYFAIGLAP